ncbi:hypothetical protein ABGB07_36305 [Micromonosporaceae bacterium B7E4]
MTDLNLDTNREPLDLDGILTDVTGHAAELPADVVDCVGCHIAVTDVPRLVAELRATRAEMDRRQAVVDAAIQAVNTDGVDEWSELVDAVGRYDAAKAGA